jgi:hypothetical protein
MDRVNVRHIALKVGSRWVVVAAHDRFGGRQGFSCEDAAGGWGVSGVSAMQAVELCRAPVTFPTRAAALQSIAPPLAGGNAKPPTSGRAPARTTAT